MGPGRPVMGGAPRLLVVQGPNLNLLGTREPAVYGATTLAEVQALLDDEAQALGVRLAHLQSNHEGVLVDRIHQARVNAEQGIIINPAGLGHTSVVLLDALVGVGLPFVEVHISNIHARESFRHRTLLSGHAQGVIAGFGVQGYTLGLRGLVSHLRSAPG